METDYRGVLGEGTVTEELDHEDIEIMSMGAEDDWARRWKALEEWLSQARGRDYVTRTPAVVLQKMRDLMGDES